MGSEIRTESVHSKPTARHGGAALVAVSLVTAVLLVVLGIRQTSFSGHIDSAAFGVAFGATLFGIGYSGRRTNEATVRGIWLILLIGAATGLTVIHTFWYPGLGLGTALAVAILLPLVLATWVAIDAPARRLATIPWTVVALFLPVLGFAIYLVVRELKPQTPPTNFE